jgi:hypothetical protein
MTSKTKNIISIIIAALASVMVLMSAFMKLSGNAEMTAGLTAGGFGSYIKIFGATELICLILFFYPKTSKIGFYLLCSYLGGAMATELSHGRPPMSAILLVLFWVAFFIKDKSNFLPTTNIQRK